MGAVNIVNYVKNIIRTMLNLSRPSSLGVFFEFLISPQINYEVERNSKSAF